MRPVRSILFVAGSLAITACSGNGASDSSAPTEPPGEVAPRLTTQPPPVTFLPTTAAPAAPDDGELAVQVFVDFFEEVARQGRDPAAYDRDALLAFAVGGVIDPILNIQRERHAAGESSDLPPGTPAGTPLFDLLRVDEPDVDATSATIVVCLFDRIAHINADGQTSTPGYQGQLEQWEVHLRRPDAASPWRVFAQEAQVVPAC